MKYLLGLIIFTLLVGLSLFQKYDSTKYLDHKLDDITWLVSHNSHLNVEDSAVLALASNQRLSLDDQLKWGVRGFMLDIDTVKCTPLQKLLDICKCEGVCLCHGECNVGSIKDGFAIKSLKFVLKKLVSYLLKNKNEFVTVFLEDYVKDTAVLEDVFKSVKNFNRLIFNPYAPEWDVLNNGWPTLRSLVEANKRLLIFDDEQRALHVNKLNGLVRSRDYLLQNHFEWSNDVYNWTKLNSTPDDELGQLLARKNITFGELHMSDCFSLHKLFNIPNWGMKKVLNLTFREHKNDLDNGRKLFLFNHFYGVQAQALLMSPLTVELMNTREFIYKRLKEKCSPFTNNKRPNYLSLDFISESTYEDVIRPINDNSSSWVYG